LNITKCVAHTSLLYRVAPKSKPLPNYQTNSASRRLFDEECDSDCTGPTTGRQRNLPTTTTTISSAAYLLTDTTYTQTAASRQDKLSIQSQKSSS